MQRLATNSNIFIALIIAIFVNLTTCWVFAQLFKFYAIKNSKVYTVYIDSNEIHSLSKNNYKKPIAQNQISYAKLHHDQHIQPPNINKITKALPSKLHLPQKNSAISPNQKKIAISDNQPIQSQANNTTSKNTTETFSSVQNNYENPTDIQNEPKIAHWIDKHKFYPQEAIFKGEEGKIKLVFLIDKNGYLQNISVIEKSQYDSLNKAAIKIVCNSSPIPHQLLANVNLPMYAKINIIFKLE